METHKRRLDYSLATNGKSLATKGDEAAVINLDSVTLAIIAGHLSSEGVEVTRI